MMAVPLITDRRRRKQQQQKEAVKPAAASERSSPSWAELEVGLLTEIAKRLGRISDYANFARVCWSWRNAALPEERLGRECAHFPGLLIASRRREKREGDRFVPAGLITQYVSKTKHRRRHNWRRAVLQPAAAAEEWDCRGTHEGWVVMVEPYDDNDDGRSNGVINVTLRNPLTKVDIPLPALHPAAPKTTPYSWRVEKAVLSSSPVGSPRGRCYVLMFYDLLIGATIIRSVGLCEVGETGQGWRHVEFTQLPITDDDHDDTADPSSTAAPNPPPPSSSPGLEDRDAIYINANSNFYILNRGILYLLDPASAAATTSSLTLLKTTAVCRIEGELPMRQTKWRESFHLDHYFYSDEAGCYVAPHFHLAELQGELLLIVRLMRYRIGGGETGVRNFVAYAWRQLENRQGHRWVEATDLGGAALFLGTRQASFSLRPGVDVAPAGAAGVRRDHIYFAVLSHVNLAGIEIGGYHYDQHHDNNKKPITTNDCDDDEEHVPNYVTNSCGGTVQLFRFDRVMNSPFREFRMPHSFWFLPMPWRLSSCIDEKGQREKGDEETDDEEDGFTDHARANRFEALHTL